jgi:hypothetical protein
MRKSTLVILGLAAILTGCSQASTTTWRDLAQAQEEGLHGTSISDGACDSVGQLIPGLLYQRPVAAAQTADASGEWSATESWAP